MSPRYDMLLQVPVVFNVVCYHGDGAFKGRREPRKSERRGAQLRSLFCSLFVCLSALFICLLDIKLLLLQHNKEFRWIPVSLSSWNTPQNVWGVTRLFLSSIRKLMMTCVSCNLFNLIVKNEKNYNNGVSHSSESRCDVYCHTYFRIFLV